MNENENTDNIGTSSESAPKKTRSGYLRTSTKTKKPAALFSNSINSINDFSEHNKVDNQNEEIKIEQNLNKPNPSTQNFYNELNPKKRSYTKKTKPKTNINNDVTPNNVTVENASDNKPNTSTNSNNLVSSANDENTIKKPSIIKEQHTIDQTENLSNSEKNLSNNQVFEKPNPYKRKTFNNSQKFDKNEYKKPFKHKHKNYKNSYDNSDDYQDSNQPPREESSLDQLLYLIRERTGFIPSKFWEKLETIQSSANPIDFSKDSNKVISYCVLFNKENIYLDLLEKYGHNLTLADFEGNLIPYCADKSSYFLDKTIIWYNKLFSDKNKLATLLIDKLIYCSFRQENNFIWLSWLDRYASQEIISYFWEAAFKFKNNVLILEGLHFKNLFSFFKENVSLFENGIDHSPQKHQIKSFLVSPKFYIDEANNLLENNFIQSNKQFEISLLEQVKDRKETESKKVEKKEENITEVIVKKKKTLDMNSSNSSPSPFL